MKVIVKVYNMSKYNRDSQKIAEVRYNITGYEVKEIPAEEILKETSGDCVDDYNEYLILHLENGETSTFGNSRVDLFRE